MKRELTIEEIKSYLEGSIRKRKEYIMESKSALNKAYGSDGLYFGEMSSTDVEILTRQLKHDKAAYATLLMVYEDIFGDPEGEEEED